MVVELEVDGEVRRLARASVWLGIVGWFGVSVKCGVWILALGMVKDWWMV